MTRISMPTAMSLDFQTKGLISNHPTALPAIFALQVSLLHFVFFVLLLWT